MSTFAYVCMSTCLHVYVPCLGMYTAQKMTPDPLTGSCERPNMCAGVWMWVLGKNRNHSYLLSHLSSPGGWKWTSNPLASTSQILGLKVFITLPVYVVSKIQLKASCMLGNHYELNYRHSPVLCISAGISLIGTEIRLSHIPLQTDISMPEPVHL